MWKPTENELNEYRELLKNNPHIVSTSETEPVSISLNKKKINKRKAEFLNAKNNLLSEFN